MHWRIGFLVLLLTTAAARGHDAKDLDDSVLYRIDFEMPDFEKNPEWKNHLRTFYTHEKEKYDCVIPVVEEAKEEKDSNEPELSPLTVLQPFFKPTSCSYRTEAYWSYEICHGTHVRQYHEEREGKNVKFQEYFLGKFDEEKTERLVKDWEESRKAGMKYKTTKIDNTKYPYFEIEMTDGTMCDIINAPRTTLVRYVCYPYSKSEIYSVKETHSCNYEAIILTSVLCIIPAFLPQDSIEVSIKCFNSPTEPHKPLSMLRQELSDMQLSADDFPVSKEVNAASGAIFLDKFGGNVDKLVLELMTSSGVDVDTTAQQQGVPGETLVKVTMPLADFSPIKDFISGKNCLTGGTGWWKYEFCYGRHVRQFHKDKKSEVELFLGYFSESAHRQWISLNPDKGTKGQAFTSLWHHYEKGTRCDRTGLPREVDVKLTCTPLTNSVTAVSMYLLEPKTCQYILVVESSIVCDLMRLVDEDGLVDDGKLQSLFEQAKVAELMQKEKEGQTGTESKTETVIDTQTREDIRA